MVTARTASVTSCSAAKTRMRFAPNETPGNKVRRKSARENSRLVKCTMAKRTGNEIPNRTIAPTSGSAVTSFVSGGPAPHDTTTKPSAMSGRWAARGGDVSPLGGWVDVVDVAEGDTTCRV
jgi:hypothetical protein